MCPRTISGKLLQTAKHFKNLILSSILLTRISPLKAGPSFAKKVNTHFILTCSMSSGLLFTNCMLYDHHSNIVRYLLHAHG
mmetsp:Transcript_1020/g.3507  ORF Transcript_1020/g.3507 Transcript_1020/m.3507 type:complete len:81 (-) Transcript_1020:136-378(-)